MPLLKPSFQITSLIFPKDNSSNTLLRSSSLNSLISKENVRNFWFKSKRKPVEIGTGNCGKPPPAKIEDLEPCKGSPSKCIEPKPKRRFFFFRKQQPQEKPSNCVKIKPPEMKLTLWEEIFGADPKRFWPDPCTCRMANRQRKKQRQDDARLLDPRYKETQGDVFLYTHLAKRCREGCMEPQPKSPPGYKLPKAVLYWKIGDGCNRKPFEEIIGDQGIENKSRKMPTSEYRVPYEELRPPDKKKKSFSCRIGIRPEDVEKPRNEELNFLKAFPKVAQVHSLSRLQMVDDKLPKKALETKVAVLEAGTGKRCRIEQLKMLIQQKKYDLSNTFE